MSKQGKTNLESRRTFLGQAAALAGAGMVLGGASKAPKTVATVTGGRVRTPNAGDAVRVGVIGTGGMGTGHCVAISGFGKDGRSNVQIGAVADVCDIHAENAKNQIEKNQGRGTVDTYRDYRELLAREDIHGVLIASPEHWHAQHAVDALTAGKDVYCEKPMTLRLEQAMDLRKVVESRPSQIFQVGTQMMMLPKYHKASEAIKSGRIGKPTWSQTSYCRNSMDGEWNYYSLNDKWEPGKNLDWDAWLGYLGPREWDPKVYARWRRYRDFSTGIIGDLLVHVMTPLVLALDMGWPTRVVASGGHYVDKDMENHDQVNLNIEFQDGHTMVVAGSTNNEVGLETMIRGHEANIYLGGRHCVIRPERLFVDEVDAEEITCEDIGNDQDQLRLNWLECIRSREPAVSNIDLASKVMVIVDLATRSMWDGHAYSFDPKTLRASRA